jgi:hypothetical protein
MSYLETDTCGLCGGLAHYDGRPAQYRYICIQCGAHRFADGSIWHPFKSVSLPGEYGRETVDETMIVKDRA